MNPIENTYIVVRSLKNGSFGSHWRPYQHRTYESAEVEANRLAAKHPGTRFFVFQMLSKTDKFKSVVVEPVGDCASCRRYPDDGCAIHDTAVSV